MFTGKICPGIAAFGMTKQNNKLIIFGGMLEYQIYTNALYTLELNTWNWSKVTNAVGEPPRARIGHSFTAIDDHKIFMFGGIINIHRKPEKHLCPRFTNDLFILHVYSKNKFAWEEVITETGPTGRESHSAVLHHNKIQDKKFLVVFGGMNGERLNDLWFLDIDELVWMQFEVNGIPPESRSLHTASLIGSQMIIFGGWINDTEDIENKENIPNYRSSNSLKILDLDNLEWQEVDIKGQIPPPRAGHCAVTSNNRVYICSGRSVYRFIQDNPAPCHDDFWFLEFAKPAKIEKVEKIQCTTKSIAIKWDRVGNANCYVLEMRRVHELNMVQSLKLVANVNQIAIAQNHKLNGKKVIIINPMHKIQQIDGCNDELFDIGEEIKAIESAAKVKKEEILKVKYFILLIFINLNKF
jgi:host cell factor